jgi:hypothetical protein
MSEVLDPSVPEVSARAAFLRGEGFVLFTAVNARVLRAIGEETPDQVSRQENLLGQLDVVGKGFNQSNLALFVVTDEVSRSDAIMKDKEGPNGFYNSFGIRQEDIEATKGGELNLFANGFGDRRFAWHFSAGVANSAVQAFVEDGRISKDEAANLTLGDWSHVIGSRWFSKLMHALAFTDNSVYSSFGSRYEYYENGGLKRHIDRSIDGFCKVRKPLLTDRQFEPTDNTWQLTATLNPEARVKLREAMRARGSLGCPVARRSARLPRSLLGFNPHLQELVRDEILTVKPDQSDDKVHVEQQETAIDRTLSLIASQLDTYDAAYGTPIPIRSKQGFLTDIRHTQLKPTNVLRRAA